MAKVQLHVKRLDNDEIVHSVDVTGKNQHRIEKCMLGMLRQMDTDTYYIDDSETD